MLAMMLTLLVASLAIGCSSAPETPSAPVPNFSESEVIALARSAVGRTCFDTSHRYSGSDEERSQTFTDFRYSESARFKPNGLWLVQAKTSYNIKAYIAMRDQRSRSGKLEYAIKDGLTAMGTFKGAVQQGDRSIYECIVLVNDATGKVTQN